MKYISAAFLLVMLACQNSGSGDGGKPSDTALATPAPPKVIDSTTLGGRWYLQAVLPSDTATGKTPWLDLSLDLTQFTGNTGCNSMHGKFYFSKTDSSLAFANKIVLSKMSCPGYNEPAFMKSLKNAARYKLRNGTMTLLGDDRSELSHWNRGRSDIHN